MRNGREHRFLLNHTSRVLGLLVTAVILAACSVGSPTASQSSPAVAGAEVAPEASERIAKAIDEQVRAGSAAGIDYSGLRAILVTVDGRTMLERYYRGAAADDTHDIQSVTKSILSTLVGIAVGEGKLHLDDRLATLLPKYKAVMKQQTANATLRQVLTMNAGFANRQQFESARDWNRYIIAGAESPPGQQFEYSNEGAHLVSTILENATGEPVLKYARSRLFGPLGIVTKPAYTSAVDLGDLAGYQKAGFAWPVDPQGHATGHGWMKLRARDMAKIGQLYLDQGKWQGSRVLPAEWTQEATVNQSSTDAAGFGGTGYGYLWWVRAPGPDPAYAAVGYGGQLIEVIPNLRLVVATAADLNYTNPADHFVDTGLMMAIVESVIAPALRAK